MRVLVLLADISSLIVVLGLMMLSVPLVDFIFSEPISLYFVYSSLVYTSSGLLAVLLLRRVGRVGETGFMEAYLASALSWLLIPFLAAIPLHLEIGIPLIDAFFESVSGFTGTGLTVISDLDHLKKSINWWRALMQWSGELGFVVFAMTIIPFFWRYGYILYSIERPVRVMHTLRQTAKRIAGIYVFFTLLGVVLLYYSGVNLYDSVIHTMTAIATGGMSNYNLNYEAVYDYAPLSVIPAILVMAVGGANFLVLSQLMDFKFKEASRSEELRYYTIVMAALSAVTTLLLAIHGVHYTTPLVLGVFNTVSAMTTTGFNIGNVGGFPADVKMMLILAMFIGGMTFSTAGGIKVYRLVILLKKLKAYSISMLLHGRVSPHVTVDGKIIDDEEVSSALLLVILHATVVVATASIVKIAMPEADFLDALFEATSATSDVGLSAGLTSASMPLAAKAALIAGMYLGRLEHLPILILVGYTAGRSIYRAFKS